MRGAVSNDRPYRNRRDFIATLAGAAVTAARRACAAAWPRTYRLGDIFPVGRETPGIVAFFDEMRTFGFVEGQNLTVLPNGFNVRNDELADQTDALVKAAPDAIISGPDNYTRVCNS